MPQLHGATAETVAAKERAPLSLTARGEAYDRFFTSILEKFKEFRPGVTSAVKGGGGNNWVGFPAGLYYSEFDWWFPQGKGFAVQLYLDGPTRGQVKSAFDQLVAQRGPIDLAVGAGVQWERLDSAKASRIALYRPGNVYERPELADELRDWGVRTMAAFVDTFRPRLDAIAKAP